MTDTSPMTKGDRDSLIRIVKARARQAEREVDARKAILIAEVFNEATAEYEARDALWADAVAIAEECAAKANAQIQARCADLGIPSRHAPGVTLGWRPRGSEFIDSRHRAELLKLAEKRADGLAKDAKAALHHAALDYEERLIIGGLASDEAKALADALPTVEQLMPKIGLQDIGVKRWQPPEDAAAQLTTPLTPAQRRQRQILRAIEANPGASDRAIAQILDCDHKTVAKYRRDSDGELPAISGEFPSEVDE
jgi:DNA-binding CsgD family transcriptional regulator